jgi:hypothetical protein
MSNEGRAQAVEQFLLDEAVTAGVVKKIVIKLASNPNKWYKKLAPWFTQSCRNQRF